MRLLLVSTSVVPLGTQRYGGIEKMVSNYAAGLVKAGHEVTVAAPYGSVVPKGVALIETVRLPEEQDRDDIADQVAKRWHGGGYFDAIHDFSHRGTFHAASYSAVHMVWDPIVANYPFKPDNRNLCVSNWQAVRYEKMYQRKAVVGPTGFLDTSVFRPYGDERTDRFLFLGKLSAAKGADLALTYASELGVPLDIVGGLVPTEQDSPYVKMLEDGAGDSGQIRVHFNVTEEEKVRFLRACRALIYPVRQEESHWLAGIEAWCMETRTLAAGMMVLDEVSRPEFVAHTMAEFFQKMKAEPDAALLRAWGEESRAKYSVEACIAFYTDLYEKVGRGASW